MSTMTRKEKKELVQKARTKLAAIKAAIKNSKKLEQRDFFTLLAHYDVQPHKEQFGVDTRRLIKTCDDKLVVDDVIVFRNGENLEYTFQTYYKNQS